MRGKTKKLLLLGLAQILIILIMWYVNVRPHHGTTISQTSEKENQPQKTVLKLPSQESNIKPTGKEERKKAEEKESEKVEDKEPENEYWEKVEDAEPAGPAITSAFLLYIPSTQSSSVQNILLRKAITENLNVALSQPYKDMLCYPLLFTGNCPINKNDAPFDMILHQLRYDKGEIEASMKDNRKNIVLLRHPIAHLQATYYDNDWREYVNGRSFEEFIKDYYHRFAKTFDFDKHLPYRNIQLFMLGFSTSQNAMRNAFIHKTDEVYHTFHVIMFQELMLESLVFLKFELNWEYKDVITFGLHQNPENYGLDELTKTVNDTIIFYNEGDLKMYEVLLERFEQKVKHFGEDKMKIEKQILQYSINEETQKCLEKSEEAMREPMRRVEHRLTSESEGDRFCHFYVSRGSELTGLLRMTWDNKELEKKKAERKLINAKP